MLEKHDPQLIPATIAGPFLPFIIDGRASVFVTKKMEAESGSYFVLNGATFRIYSVERTQYGNMSRGQMWRGMGFGYVARYPHPDLRIQQEREDCAQERMQAFLEKHFSHIKDGQFVYMYTLRREGELLAPFEAPDPAHSAHLLKQELELYRERIARLVRNPKNDDILEELQDVIATLDEILDIIETRPIAEEIPC